MTSFSDIISQGEYQRSIIKASVYAIRYGNASTAAVGQLFDSSREVEAQEALYGVNYATWKLTDRDNCLINLWDLSEEATFESLREIYYGDDSIQRLHYLIAVDNSEICAAAVEKNVLQMEKHKKARRLRHLPVIIMLLHEGDGVDKGQLQRINAIAERVSATLLVLDNTQSSKGAMLEHVQSLILDTLFPNKNEGKVNEDGVASLAPLLARRGPVMTQELWKDAESENLVERESAMEHDVIGIVDEMMHKGVCVGHIDMEGDEESVGAQVSGSTDEIKQQEYVWLGGLKKFVADVTREGTESAGNSPKKGSRQAAAAGIGATDEDEEDDTAAFFKDLLARK
jgi:hypothetical protein